MQISVPFLDIKAQNAPLRAVLDAAIKDVIDAGAFAGGPFVASFEEDFATYCQCRHAVGVGNGTDALWLALLALGVGASPPKASPRATFPRLPSVVSDVGELGEVIKHGENGYLIRDRCGDAYAAALEQVISARVRQMRGVHGNEIDNYGDRFASTENDACASFFFAVCRTCSRCPTRGGVERQTVLMSKWLSRRGVDVSVITWGDGGPDEVIEGVRIIKIRRPSEGLPGLRMMHPRLTTLLSGMRRASADVYYYNAAEYLLRAMAIWCRQNRKSFVYSLASDVACDPHLPALGKLYERVGYRWGLCRADSVIVQTQRQQRMLSEDFGVNSVVLPIPCEVPPDDELASLLRPRVPRVVWVGRINHLSASSGYWKLRA